MLGSFSSSRALMDTGCPMPNSPPEARELTPRTVLSTTAANASSALGSLCWCCLPARSVSMHSIALHAACIRCGTRSSHDKLVSAVCLCLPYTNPCQLSLVFFIQSLFFHQLSFYLENHFSLQPFLPHSVPICAVGKTSYV